MPLLEQNLKNLILQILKLFLADSSNCVVKSGQRKNGPTVYQRYPNSIALPCLSDYILFELQIMTFSRGQNARIISLRTGDII